MTFNAFLKQDVDSIAYSHYDADSLYHSEWITRLIYIADSIYQIYPDCDFGYWGWGPQPRLRSLSPCSLPVVQEFAS